MTGLIDVDRLYSLGVVVRDLEVATLRYAEIFGIDEWDVRAYGLDRLTDVRCYGRPVAPSFRTATATTVLPVGQDSGPAGTQTAPVTFELIEPIHGETPFQEFHFRRGQGISHLTLAVRSESEWDGLKEALRQYGVRVAASMTVDEQLQRHFIDTRKALGGFLVEVQVPVGDASHATCDVTERWSHAGRYTRPEGVGPLIVQGVNHFGIVVDDVIESLSRYNEILGVERFGVRDWRTEKGLLENAYYRDAPVEHEYFTALTPFKDFGLEIIQPTMGPSHYNTEFRDRWGPGVHHLLLNVTENSEEWDSRQKWLAGIGVPLAMGADLFDGAAAFCYHDTTEALGGYIVESVLVRQEPSEDAFSPDYVVDFSALTARI